MKKKQKAGTDQLTPDEIETIIKKLQHTEALDQMVSQENSTKHLRKS